MIYYNQGIMGIYHGLWLCPWYVHYTWGLSTKWTYHGLSWHIVRENGCVWIHTADPVIHHQPARSRKIGENQPALSRELWGFVQQNLTLIFLTVSAYCNPIVDIRIWFTMASIVDLNCIQINKNPGMHFHQIIPCISELPGPRTLEWSFKWCMTCWS